MPNLTINGHQFEVPEGLLSRYHRWLYPRD
jgi:hypothetical protein